MTQNTFGNQRFVEARNVPRGHQIDLKVPACPVTDGQQSHQRQEIRYILTFFLGGILAMT
jgi:hypothetical protein